MNLKIAGKRALITGAGRGLGRSVASCLANEGCFVVAVSRTESDINSLMLEIGGKEAGHCGISKDLMELGSPEKLVAHLNQYVGAIDIIVHNLGGTLDITDPFCSIQDWERLWRFNMGISLELNLLLLPYMQKQKWGRIVHIASIAATENQGPVPYCSIKSAITSYARSMGRVVAADGIVISSVLPGAVFTKDGYWDYTSKNNPEHVEKYLNERMAIKRFGTPDEIGHPVAFLCSELASFFIGSSVPIDGGQGRSFFSN